MRENMMKRGAWKDGEDREFPLVRSVGRYSSLVMAPFPTLQYLVHFTRVSIHCGLTPAPLSRRVEMFLARTTWKEKEGGSVSLWSL